MVTYSIIYVLTNSQLSDLNKMGFEALLICLTNIFKTLSEQCTVCEVDNAPAFKLNFYHYTILNIVQKWSWLLERILLSPVILPW
jgi:hypothetical protein